MISMMRTAAKLALIFAVLYAGVHFGYARLEKELLNGTCVPFRNGERKKEQPALRPAAGAKAEPNAAAQDFQIIVRRNIFQIVLEENKAEVQPEKPVEAMPTALNMTLSGTVVGSQETARAVIADGPKKEQKLLRIGDGIQGAVVKAIEWNKVVLEVNGKTEVLKMPELKSRGARRPPPLSRVGPQDASVPVPPEVAPPVPENMPSFPAEAAAGRGPSIRRRPVLRPHRRIDLPPDAPVPLPDGTMANPPDMQEMPPSDGAMLEDPIILPEQPEMPPPVDVPPPESN